MTASGTTTFRSVPGAGAVVLQPSGDLDAANVGAFRTALADAVAVDRPLVVVDLAEVAFLDSAGLSVIFAAQRRLPAGRRLVLGNVPRRMVRSLRLAAVGTVVDFHPEGEEQPWREAAADPAP